MNKNSKMLLVIAILSIWNSILFYNYQYGISVVLFIIPLLITILYFLNKNKKITNKKSIILTIPILLLSATYFIFQNKIFELLNRLVIIFLLDTMIILLYEKKFELKGITVNIKKLLIKPFSFFSNTFNLIKIELNKFQKHSKINFKLIKSIIVTLTILIVIISLLSSADMIFANIFENFNRLLSRLFKNANFTSLILRLISIGILFFYLSSTMLYLKINFKYEYKNSSLKKSIDFTTLKMVMIACNIIYIVFDIIQIKSLFLHSISMNITYAEYARSGFWQLLLVSIINFLIIMYAKKVNQDDKIVRISSLVLIGLTFLILLSSVFRIHMYEQVFGYTRLRLFAYIILFTEAILFIPTIIYIIKNKFNLFKTYFIIIITIYLIINFINIDKIIAHENINKYYRSNKIDLEYILSLSNDANEEIIRLYKNTKEEEIKERIKYHFKIQLTKEKKSMDIREFNISKYNQKKQIERIIKDN